MVPAAFETLDLDPHLGYLLGLEQIESNVTQHGEVLSGVVGACAVVILTESYVQYPVQVVLNAPVPTCCLRKLSHMGNTAQIVAPLAADHTVYFPLGLHHAYALQVGPTLI